MRPERPPAPPGNALMALVAGARRAYGRSDCIPVDVAANCFKKETRQQHARSLAVFLQEHGCGFIASHALAFRQQAFLAVGQVFYSVTLELKKSLRNSSSGLTATLKASYKSAEPFFGTAPCSEGKEPAEATARGRVMAAIRKLRTRCWLGGCALAMFQAVHCRTIRK